ncbi:Type III secretion cytoplasmic ATP synthase (YscN,SpaL,MxiB,HrcN,EscN) [Crocosphaera watsonii WH 0402]|uniref:Type III secretion cytoplasmic ATP synthase (YscN,SpaL,MxiB,HrcN,EscN) n=1 Tax=Crocosphaera watsonii WH 0402 TaxID=1284629 RepID=T2JX40_CROWT|nr:Type III secretion cytoplasmic ATP synthase (YscN,SpaL,MxiB,HrcN,EscN) [Crocosphaera watsonii WH 0402]
MSTPEPLTGGVPYKRLGKPQATGTWEWSSTNKLSRANPCF